MVAPMEGLFEAHQKKVASLFDYFISSIGITSKSGPIIQVQSYTHSKKSLLLLPKEINNDRK